MRVEQTSGGQSGAAGMLKVQPPSAFARCAISDTDLRCNLLGRRECDAMPVTVVFTPSAMFESADERRIRCSVLTQRMMPPGNAPTM
eukprot:3309453-Rhodomonas_salina.3